MAQSSDPGSPETGLAGLGDLERVRRFFGATAGPLRAELLAGGRSNLTYLVTDGSSRWVLRRPPLGELTPSAHDLAREYRVVSALYGHVPVPPAVALCEDADVLGVPFAVTGYVDGLLLRTREDLAAYPPARLRECAFGLIDTLAALHAVSYRDVGLGNFGRWEGYLERQVRRWMDQWQRVATRELPDLDTLYRGLADRVPRESGGSIVHGDFRVDNVLLDRADLGTVRAIVDWEMATIGDPLADLGLTLVYRDPAFAPVIADGAASTSVLFPAPDELAERYARSSGRDLGKLGFYLALGYFKSAVIAEGIHNRYLRGMTVGDGFTGIGQTVPPLAAAGLRALGGQAEGGSQWE
jgi:aminoglycoside phosphotransferase (APT) family kinase protein